MPRSLPLQGQIPAPVTRPFPPLAAKGFRPFFLLAGVFAAALVPVWMLMLSTVLTPVRYLEPAAWHAHEMVFGFAAAVVAGFLLTAVGNWTQRETLTGAPLLALAACWVAGRLAMALAEQLPPGIPALVDLAFLPLLGVALARPLVATKSYRNFVMLAVLAALFAANVTVHLAALGALPESSARRACLVGVDLVVLMILVIAGRVFPMFTRNATGVASIRSIPKLDGLTLFGMAVLTLVDTRAPDTRLGAVAAAVVAVLAVARAVHWGTRHSLREPLLWVLHAGYAWLVLGLVLRALAGFGPITSSLGMHALTVGAIGSITLGMMARVALGHTGRLLVAPRPMAWAFGAVNAAAVARVLVPLVFPFRYFDALIAAAVLWTIAFGLFVAVYAPIVATPRTDGKPG
jgi:uncharacterized protein involved in response to NO